MRFLKIEDDDSPGYASVRWFSKPTYPHNVPLVVCVRDDGGEVDFMFTSIIPLTSIEPSRVIVENDGDVFYMMRDSGYDRID